MEYGADAIIMNYTVFNKELENQGRQLGRMESTLGAGQDPLSVVKSRLMMILGFNTFKIYLLWDICKFEFSNG